MSQSPSARGNDRDRRPYANGPQGQYDLRYSNGARHPTSNMYPGESQTQSGSLNAQPEAAADGDSGSWNANTHEWNTRVTQADFAANRIANGGRDVITQGPLAFIGAEAHYEVGDTKEDMEDLKLQMYEANRVQSLPIDALNNVDGLTITSSLRVVGRSTVFKSKDHDLQRRLAQQKLDHEYRMAQLQLQAQANASGAVPPGYPTNGLSSKLESFGNEFSG